jgi:drug/metabolite transporter (DMT)-like permease
MFAMATANYLNGVLGHLGLKILFYYNIGPLVVSSTYFLAKNFGLFEPNTKRSVSRQTGIPSLLNIQRSLIKNDDDEYDFKMIGFIFLSAFL